MLETVHRQYLAAGITSISERGAMLDGFKTYQALKAANRLRVRTTVTVRIPRPDDSAEVERFITSLPFKFGEGDEWLKAGPLKLTVDGGILIGTAYMREPYGLGARQLYAVEDPAYRGFLTLTPEQVASAVLIGHRHGWQMIATSPATPASTSCSMPTRRRRKPRHHPIDGIRSCTPTSFIRKRPPARRVCMCPWTRSRPGTTRMAMRWPARSAVSGSLTSSASTLAEGGRGRDDQHRSHVRARSRRCDEPVQPVPDDVHGDHAADRVRSDHRRDEAISREDALRMMTSTAARFSFDEKNTGSIEVGKLGDFVVLDDHFMTCPPERLRSIRPELTVIGGAVVYEESGK